MAIRAFIPHNLTLTLLGVGLLWFGWFGFNAGSRLAADGVAGNAFLVTHMAAAMGALTWVFAEWILKEQAHNIGTRVGRCCGTGFDNTCFGICRALGRSDNRGSGRGHLLYGRAFQRTSRIR